VKAEADDLSGFSLHEEDALAEALPEIEELSAPEELAKADFGEDVDRQAAKSSEPVAIHPDELPSSLSDELFVEEAAAPPEEALLAEKAARPAAKPKAAPAPEGAEDDDHLKSEIRSVLSYLDKLLDSLPEDKIEEFARSEHFDTYKRLFEELGLV